MVCPLTSGDGEEEHGERETGTSRPPVRQMSSAFEYHTVSTYFDPPVVSDLR
jgi:hypothetical protein